MLPDAAIGTVIAATIAGLISFVGLIISKENKTSDFRQIWIDSLRKEISLIISHANLLDSYKEVSNGNPIEIWKDTREYFSEVNSAISSIELRINPEEPSNIKLLGALRTLEKVLVTPQNKRTENDRLKIEREIIVTSQKILKNEWSRVKSGELFYKSAKWAALIIFIAGGLSLLLLYFSNNWFKPFASLTGTG